MKTTASQSTRPLHIIAADIRRAWTKVNYGAVPYLNAMFCLRGIGDMYGHDDAGSIVRYFLANAGTWRGEDAKRIKAELKAMLPY